MTELVITHTISFQCCEFFNRNLLELYNSFIDALQQGASQFEQQAGKLKSKFWLQNLKVSRKYLFV